MINNTPVSVPPINVLYFCFLNIVKKNQCLWIEDWQGLWKHSCIIQSSRHRSSLCFGCIENQYKSNTEAEQKADSHFFLHDYLSEDREEIMRKIKELIEFTKRANSRAKFKTDNSRASGLYISFQKFRWNIDKYLLEE
mgnify:CR=1 FL=1